MRDQISALNEEKNALLDYIEEAGLADQQRDDSLERDQLLTQIETLRHQNEQLLKQTYSSPNFAEQPYRDQQEIPSEIHSPQCEDTFGNDNLQKKLQLTIIREKEKL